MSTGMRLGSCFEIPLRPFFLIAVALRPDLLQLRPKLC
jgi:hypothetical protein